MSESFPGSSAHLAAPAAPAGNVRWALLGVMLAMLLSMLDNTIVGTSLPTIVRDLGSLNHLSWVVSAYLLATAASTPVWGKFGDLYGRRRLYLASVVVFLAGSALSGGVITGHLGWRWAFYINIPLGLTALVWCQLMLHLPAGQGRAGIDWPGI